MIATHQGEPTRLSTRQKLGYGAGDMGAALSYSTVSFFLQYYLINSVGLHSDIAGYVLMGGRIFDAVLDPGMGMFSDRTRTRWGRRIPFLLFGSVPFGLSFALMWALPQASQAAIFAIASAAVMFHMITFAATTIPYAALTPELATDYNERTSLTSYRTAFAIIASLIAAAVPRPLAAAFNRWNGLPENAGWGWTRVGMTFGVIMVAAWLVVVLSVRETARPSEPPAKTSLFAEYRSLFGIYGYPHMLLLFLVVTVAVAAVSAILPFYLDTVGLGPDVQGIMLFMIFVLAIVMLPLWTWVASRFGKKKGLAAGLLVYASGLLAQALLAPRGAVSSTLVITGLFIGIGLSAVLLFPWAMLPDVIEFDELKTGQRREGSIYSLFAVTQKLAYALGALINGQVLSYVGYDRAAAEQSAPAITGIKFMLGPAPALLILGALVLVWTYPITQAKHNELRAELAKRAQLVDPDATGRS